MPILQIYVDEDTYERLAAIARLEENDRGPEELAESAVSEAALDYFRRRDFRDDPARTTTEGKTHV